MATAESAGTHVIELRAEGDAIERVTLDIRYKRIHVHPPIGKQKRYPSLDLAVIHATRSLPLPIDWCFATPPVEVTDIKFMH